MSDLDVSDHFVHFKHLAPIPVTLSLSLKESFFIGDTLPNGLFGGHHPQLECLELYHVMFHWGNTLTSGLTTLQITLVEHTHHSGLLRHMLHTLQRLLDLNLLSLVCALPQENCRASALCTEKHQAVLRALRDL